jgi:hypothetical protein
MTLIIISIPLMVLAVAIAVGPLVVLSLAEHRRTVETTSLTTDLRTEVSKKDAEEYPQAA